MLTSVQEHPEENAIVLWLAAIVLAAVIGFGLGASFDLGDTPAVSSAANTQIAPHPDWHGNVKRSQDW